MKRIYVANSEMSIRSTEYLHYRRHPFGTQHEEAKRRLLRDAFAWPDAVPCSRTKTKEVVNQMSFNVFLKLNILHGDVNSLIKFQYS